MNPLARLSFFLIFSISTLIADTFFLVLFHAFFSFIFIYSILNNWKEWKRHVMPFIKFFPLTGIIFFFISFTITVRPVFDIMIDVSLATVRMIVMINIMTVYLIQAKPQDIYIAMRSSWFSLNKKWKWLDDLLLFFEITIRFFPNFQYEWENLQRSQRALGFNSKQGFYRRLISVSKFIPEFIIISLNKSDTLTSNVIMRGYGNYFPRSVYPFISFQWSDKLIILVTVIFFLVMHFYVSV